MPRHNRNVIRMRFMESRPVAEELDKCVGSIHMICHRALRQLRELIEQSET